MGITVPSNVEIVDKPGRLNENMLYHVAFAGFNNEFQDCGKNVSIKTLRPGDPLHALFFQPGYPNTYIICLTPIGLISILSDDIELENEMNNE